MTTWRELKAQGVHRCCIMYKDGTQCRRRAVEQFEWSWCGKHGPIMAAHIKHANEAIKAQLKSDDEVL
jgi:hypothetical protein